MQASRIHGRGVFARREFHRGELVLPIDDSRVVTASDPLDSSKGELEHHQDYLGDHDVLMQEPERYINHCCEPSALVKTYDGGRYVVVYRDLSAGEEITYDYCINSYGDFEWECRCGHPRCRGRHNTDFFRLPDEKLIEYLPLLDDWFVEWKRETIETLRARFADSA